MYLDNAATSFPKPRESIRAVRDFLTLMGGNPGRGGHIRSIEAARLIFEARERLTGFINGADSRRLIFTGNGTDSLNLAILGLFHRGDHVVTTSLEHNSVMRPLDFLTKSRKVEVTVIPCDQKGELDLDHLRRSLRKKTRAVIINHGSNVIGTIQDVAKIRSLIDDRILILDACQTVGNVPIDVRGLGIDIICFSCHKALFGTQGLGAIYIREGIDLTPLTFGGTGSRSEQTEQPEAWPDKFESGTPNTPGIAGLLGGLRFIERIGLANIARKKKRLAKSLIKGLEEIEGIVIYGGPHKDETLPVILFNMKGREPSEIGYECNRAGISVRVGLHCSPLAHKTVGTFPHGGVRVSPGYFTKQEELQKLSEVLNHLGKK
jgi:cysteine desulfurase / selenocysteine lyase